MQTNLFDQSNLNKIAFRKNLAVFDLQAAQESLEKWGKTLDAPQDLPEKTEAIRRLSASVNKKNELAELWLTYRTTDFLQPLKGSFKFLFKGLSKALKKHLSPEACAFLLPALHPAQIFIACDDFVTAIQCCERFLKKNGENAFVRELQGAALFKAGKEKAGLVAYTFAMFNNPTALSAEYLFPKKYNRKLRFFVQKFNDPAKAWLYLPFALWQEGLTYIEPEAYPFERFLLQTIAQQNSAIAGRAQEHTLHFLHVLYLAEMTRLRGGKQNSVMQLNELRNELQQTNPFLFNSYLRVLKTFGHV